MSGFLTTYQPIFLVNPPRIHTDLLWDLGILFGGITTLYFLLVLVFRYRIASRRRQVHLRKRELAPMITKFLFFRQDIDLNEREAYIRMKIEIRDQLKNPFNREVLTEVLMDLRQDVSGEARTRLLSLYQDLGLHLDAFQKLKSARWEKVSMGILELTEMRVDQAYHFVKKRINDRRSVIRRQAQLAIVNLKEEGIRYVLDTARHPISEWQQLKMMELLKHKEDFIPPRFQDWLISENRDVVLFALRLIRHYRQSDASKAIITLLQHRSQEIQMAALECIREFRFTEARTPMKQEFENAIAEVKILILDALREVAAEEDLPWLQKRAARDPSFLVRNKAGMVINALKPETVLPTKDIRPVPEEGDAFDREAEAPVPFGETARAPEAHGEFDRAARKGFGIPQADFTDIRLDPDRDPDWLMSRELSKPAHEFNFGALPEDDWTPEHEEIFTQCFLQELKELLSLGPARVSLPEVSLDFLPVITKEPSNTPHMEPHESIPEWLRKLDVQAEILSADSGYAKVLREILLEDLAEYGEVFNTDFVPWVTGTADTNPSKTSGTSAEPDLDPDFEVIADGIQQIHLPNEDTRPHVETGGEASVPEGEMNYFSIFREFFRSYDRESKLILLDEIPGIGTVKELHFLEGVFEDPDEKVANRARKVYQLLAKRLEIDPKALENKGTQALWTPSSASRNNVPGENEQPYVLPGDEDPQEDECSFIPEFDPLVVPQQRYAKKTRKRKNRLFRFLGGTQNSTDE